MESRIRIQRLSHSVEGVKFQCSQDLKTSVDATETAPRIG